MRNGAFERREAGHLPGLLGEFRAVDRAFVHALRFAISLSPRSRFVPRGVRRVPE